ncbi:MAG: methyltransferase domain-containing protein [Deltaproteobacteria bacterium]|nr:methyltransferase domain-containing protein [Deltaproteobacteria bacterium]
MTFDDLRALAAGFQPSQLLLTALELGVFDLVADGPRSVAEIARELDLDPRATEIAANALVALGLLELGPRGYDNTEAVARFLVRASADYRGSVLLHLHATWEDWAGLSETWRTGRPALRRKTQQLPSSPEGLRHFILGMENVTRELAPLLADRLPLAGCRRVLDLGGGPGNYALAFVRRWPNLHVAHFDLPPTSVIARDFLSGRDGAERISFQEGDFLTAPLGEGYDFVWASQIVHMLSEDEGRRLLGRVAQTLRPGGRVGVHDQFLEPSRTAPRGAALFGVHMLVATDGGRTYALDEVLGWLGDAGLVPESPLDYGGPSRVALARKEDRP